MARLVCPRCRHSVEAAPEAAGNFVECEYCGTQIPLTRPRAGLQAESFNPSRNEGLVSAGEGEHDEDGPMLRPSPEIDHEELIDMTAMVDIVFFLLIFFLVTSLHQLEASIPIPTPRSADGKGGQPSLQPQVEEENDALEVTIGSQNEIRVDGIPIRDLEDLRTRFQVVLRSPNHPRRLLVIGHAEATHGTAVSILDAGYEAGFEKIGLSIGAAETDP